MNFRLTKWKSIISILGFLIVDVVISYFIANNIQCADFGKCPGFNDFLISWLITFPALVILVIIYIIWSLVERK